jgi:hypothetical protein
MAAMENGSPFPMSAHPFSMAIMPFLQPLSFQTALASFLGGMCARPEAA